MYSFVVTVPSSLKTVEEAKGLLLDVPADSTDVILNCQHAKKLSEEVCDVLVKGFTVDLGFKLNVLEAKALTRINMTSSVVKFDVKDEVVFNQFVYA